MIKITNVNATKLVDEFLTANIKFDQNNIITNDDNSELIIIFADDVDMDLVQTIIDAHDTTPIATTPSDKDRIVELEKENKLLKAQNNALTERTDFHEEVMTEIILTITP